MPESWVAIQDAETQWEALRRIVTGDLETAAEAAATHARNLNAAWDAGRRDAWTSAVARRNQSQAVLGYMDRLEKQQREEDGDD